MLVSNYALVRILVLRFVIPYASMKVNSYAMKLHPTYGALLGVSLLNARLCEFSFLGWLLLNLFASIHLY